MQLSRSIKTSMKGIDPKLTQLHAATQFAYLHLQESLCEKMKMSYTKRLLFCHRFELH